MKTRWLIALACMLLTACNNATETKPPASSEKQAQEAPAPASKADETPADETPADETPAAETPAGGESSSLTGREKFNQVTQAFAAKSRAWMDEYRKASADERAELMKQRPLSGEVAEEVLAIAQTDQEVEFDALLWVTRSGRGTEAAETAIELLFANYIERPEMASISAGLANASEDQAESVQSKLGKLIEQSPHEAVQASALYALATFVNRKSEVDEAEVKTLYEQLTKDYGKLKPNDRSRTYGEMAAAAIFEMENLQIGKTVPEIEAEDLDGVTFKLSDYRGKVVLIDFWGDW